MLTLSKESDRSSLGVASHSERSHGRRSTAVSAENGAVAQYHPFVSASPTRTLALSVDRKVF
ncbi:MAG: hypothetical protein KME31_27130 [Tolypothrix carrinoi HA7290-LM1]|nr:hypothetical protein [Tolypothrix carrinoi HA7290-LM1]